MKNIVSVAIFSAVLVAGIAPVSAMDTENTKAQVSDTNARSHLNTPSEQTLPSVLAGYHTPLRAPEKPERPDGSSEPLHTAPVDSIKLAGHHSPL